MSIGASQSPLVSAIIVNHNRADLLPICLESILAQSYRRMEITVVDNGSTDESEAVVRRYPVRWLPTGCNLGMGPAYNCGAQVAQGEYFLFLNEDIRLEHTCVANLVSVLEDDPDIFSADPIQVDWEGNRIVHFRAVLRPPESLREILRGVHIPLPPLIRGYLPATEVVDVPWGCGGSLMVRRTMFKTVGGWDSAFFIDFEDVDLCWRAWLRGWRSVMVPRARVWHKVRMPDPTEAKRRWGLNYHLSEADVKRIRAQQMNHLRFILKTQPTEGVAVFLALKVISALAHAVTGRTVVAAATARAFWRMIGGLSGILRERSAIQRSAVLSIADLVPRFRTDGKPTADEWPADMLAMSAAEPLAAREMEEGPTVSIVIPTGRRPHLLDRLLASIAKVEYPRERLQVIVVGEGGDDAAEVVGRWNTGFHLPVTYYVPFEDPYGGRSPALKRNFGAGQAVGEILAFTDDDCEVDPRWICEAVEYFRDPQVGAVEGRTHIPASSLPSLTSRGSQRLTLPGGYQTCNMFYRRTVFEEIGGFDLSFQYYLEDTDLAFSALQRRWRIVYAPGAVVEHPVLPGKPLKLFTVARTVRVLPYFRRKHAMLGKAATARFRLLDRSHYPYLIGYTISLAALAIRTDFALLGLALVLVVAVPLHATRLFRELKWRWPEVLQTALCLPVIPVARLWWFVTGWFDLWTGRSPSLPGPV